MTNYYIFGGPSDRNGMGVRFTSIVAARKYAIRMLEAPKVKYDSVDIFTRNDPKWVIIPKNAVYGTVSKTQWYEGSYFDNFYWTHDWETVKLNKDGTIKRGY